MTQGKAIAIAVFIGVMAFFFWFAINHAGDISGERGSPQDDDSYITNIDQIDVANHFLERNVPFGVKLIIDETSEKFYHYPDNTYSVCGMTRVQQDAIVEAEHFMVYVHDGVGIGYFGDDHTPHGLTEFSNIWRQRCRHQQFNLSASIRWTPPPLPLGVINARDLMPYLLLKRNYKPTDQFAKGFNDNALIGRRFYITLSVGSDDAPLSFRYDSDTETLSIHVFFEGTADSTYLVLQSDTEYGAPTPMSNAFGVTASVTPVTKTLVAIGALDGKSLHLFLSDSSDLDKEIRMKPDVARSAVAGLKLTVEGIVTQASDGHAINCLTSTEEPTITHTFPTTTNVCVVSATFDKLHLISPKAGTLAEWAPLNRRIGHLTRSRHRE